MDRNVHNGADTCGRRTLTTEAIGNAASDANDKHRGCRNYDGQYPQPDDPDQWSAQRDHASSPSAGYQDEYQPCVNMQAIFR
jgi:hypothetical protein